MPNECTTKKPFYKSFLFGWVLYHFLSWVVTIWLILLLPSETSKMIQDQILSLPGIIVSVANIFFMIFFYKRSNSRREEKVNKKD